MKLWEKCLELIIMNKITPNQGVSLSCQASDSSPEAASTDKLIYIDTHNRNVARVLCSPGDASKTSKTLANGEILRQYGTHDDGFSYICESHPKRGSYQRLMILGENPSEVQSITEVLKTENLSVERGFLGKNSLSLKSESIEPLPNITYHPKEERRYSQSQDGHTVSLIEQDLFDGLIKIKHDPISKSRALMIGDLIYHMDLDLEKSKSYEIPFPQGESTDFTIPAFKPVEYSDMLDLEISPQKIKVKFNDEGEINVYNADDDLLTKYTSQGDRIDYDSAENINTVIDKNGTLYQFKESQPYNKSKADGVFIAYDQNIEGLAKQVFSTGHGRNIAIFDKGIGKLVTIADTPEP
jgi:hypothetical protein